MGDGDRGGPGLDDAILVAMERGLYAALWGSEGSFRALRTQARRTHAFAEVRVREQLRKPLLPPMKPASRV